MHMKTADGHGFTGLGLLDANRELHCQSCIIAVLALEKHGTGSGTAKQG